MISLIDFDTRPTLELWDIQHINPENTYIAISRDVSDAFRLCSLLEGNQGFNHIRNVIIAMIAHGQIRQSSIRLLDPPVAQEIYPGSFLVARFWWDCEWAKGDHPAVNFRCKLVTGSPMNNWPYTVVLTAVDLPD